jgi:hypothetical protein
VSQFCLRQFEAQGVEQLDDAVGGLAGEVGRPGEHKVVVADAPVQAPERLEDPQAEPARGLGETETRPPLDVPQSRLDGCLEQRPRRLGRLDVAVAGASGMRGEVFLIDGEQCGKDGVSHIVGVDLGQSRARGVLGTTFELAIGSDEIVDHGCLLGVAGDRERRGCGPARSSAPPVPVCSDHHPERAVRGKT